MPVWPVRTVIDLRSPKEQAVTRHPLLTEGASVHEVSLLSDSEVAEQHLLTGLDLVYAGITSNARGQLAQVFTLAATAPAPVLLHCAAGKDRTGIATAMLLHAAGVDAADVVADYTATERHMDSVLARIRRTDPSFARKESTCTTTTLRARHPRPSAESWSSGTTTPAAFTGGCAIAGSSPV